jgi:hypothetical protein
MNLLGGAGRRRRPTIPGQHYNPKVARAVIYMAKKGHPALHWHGHGQARPYATRPYVTRRPIVSCCLVLSCRIADTSTTLKGSGHVVPCHRARLR